MIEIADTGPGIASSDLEKLFEIRFVSKQDRVSMGLGLPMAQRIVEGHGGELTVGSEPGKGTAFSIYLPTRR